MTVRPGHTRLAARWVWLDFRRQGRMWVRLLLQPVMLLAVVGGVPLAVVIVSGQSAHATSHTAAVQAPDHPDGILAVIRDAGFRVRLVPSAAAAIGDERATVGLVLPANADRMIAAGATLDVTVLAMTADDAGRVAAADLNTALRRYAVERAAARQAPGIASVPIVIAEPATVVTSAVDSRDLIARFLPTLLVISLLGAASTAQGLLSGARDNRTVEALLALPFRRTELVAGIGIAGAAIGAIPAVLMVVPMAAVAALIASGHTTAGATGAATGSVGAAVAAAGTVGAALLLLATATLTGIFVGARVRSSTGAGAIIGGLAVVGVAVPFIPDLSRNAAAYAAPVLGPLVLCRAAVAGRVIPAGAALAVAGGLAGLVVLGRATASTIATRGLARAA